MNLQIPALTFLVTCAVKLCSAVSLELVAEKAPSLISEQSVYVWVTQSVKNDQKWLNPMYAILQGRTCLSVCLQKAALYATSNLLRCCSIFIPPCPKKLCSDFSARALTGLGHTVVWAEKGQILCWLLKILTIFLLGGWSQSSHVPALCLHGWLILPVRGAWKRFGSIHSGPWFAWYFNSIIEFCPSGNVYQSPGTPPHLQRIGNISSCAWIWPCDCTCL